VGPAAAAAAVDVDVVSGKAVVVVAGGISTRYSTFLPLAVSTTCVLPLTSTLLFSTFSSLLPFFNVLLPVPPAAAEFRFGGCSFAGSGGGGGLAVSDESSRFEGGASFKGAGGATGRARIFLAGGG
jgi:hypothetical protein